MIHYIVIALVILIMIGYKHSLNGNIMTRPGHLLNVREGGEEIEENPRFLLGKLNGNRKYKTSVGEMYRCEG